MFLNWLFQLTTNVKTLSFLLSTRLTSKFNFLFDNIKLSFKLEPILHAKAFHKTYAWDIDSTSKLNFISVSSINALVLFYKSVIWFKARAIYFVNNWIYTTNHKRIAVNYFWFVIFAGIVGMVLATIIRLEMAYPGVGILAGDSLQYLSVVTAHAVVMVFFMIIPLLFGAFGNSLLPTQLGVHDVAFPRLNSAAFWFLPAGLLMLCQLVCLDRRYQRMNCFNIREVQALLKGRFYSDLINSHDHHEFLNKTTLGLRFKTNNIDVINPNMLLFYRHGITTTPVSRNQTYFTSSIDQVHSYNFLSTNSFFFKNIRFFNEHLSSFVFDNLYNFVWGLLDSITLGSSAYISNNIGKANFLAALQSTGSFFVSEAHRFFVSFWLIIDFSESIHFTISYYINSVSMFLTNLMFGLMDNNMGIHKERLAVRPVTVHVEIVTNGTLSEFAFSVFHNLANRSILVFVRSAVIVITEVSERWFNAAIYILSFKWISLPTYVISNNEILNTFASMFKSTLDTIYSSINNYMLFTNFTNIPFYFNSLVGLNDFQNIILTGIRNLFSSNNQLTNSLPSSVVNNEVVSPTVNFSTSTITEKVLTSGEEVSSNFRYQKFSNPVFRYDYKAGNYFPKDDFTLHRHMFVSISEITGGIRKSAWFFSPDFMELFSNSVSNYFDTIGVTSSEFLYTDIQRRAQPYISFTDSFYNFYYLLSDSSEFMNNRWLSLNVMDQKFYRMFTTSSMQQRIYGNWRQLKFTREAWRCRLLSARHQKTLYRRYLSEDGIFWGIERNAKDVLPGWAMITPFSARTRFTAIGKVDIGLMGVFLVLNSSIVSSANFLVTYRYLSTLNNRKMRDARSFFTEGIMVASWMMIAANPMLAIGILMLLSDRHWQTSFFDYSGGGDTVLFQHMFWFFGHPEVYVVMIPAFGFNNTILSFYLRKRVSARASLMYSMYTIAFLGFFVWGHHMYMVGLAHTTRMLFSTLTVMISVPAATKLMHWCVTLVNSSLWVELPFLFALLFIFFFVSGGISGMAVAHTGMDILFHDSYYVIGHFHVMFAGAAMFASFGAFYFYFPSIFGVKFSRVWGYLHILYFLLGQLMTVIPMFWLGYSGMPRRILDYPAALGGWHSIVSAGHLLSVAGLMAFFIMIFDSLRQGRAATRNSFGISRFNTRLNFYLYEVARTRFVQRRGWYISRYNRSNALSLNELNYNNHEVLETTLYSYVLVQSK